MELTDNEKQYFYEEIQRACPAEEDLRIIFIDNEGKFGKNFYNQIHGNTYRNKLTFLTKELERRGLIHDFIEVVRKDYHNFAQEL